MEKPASAPATLHPGRIGQLNSMTIQIPLEILGTLVVLYGLRQVFNDIFHPTKSGSLSDWVGRAFSASLRNTRFRGSIGPLALVSVILAWVALLTFGFALIYCGVLTTRFADSAAISPHPTFARTLLRALYTSLGSFDTFQTFNISPSTDGLRLVIALEGLIGISMITASVSWTVLLYPALARSRWFARSVSLILRAQERTGLSAVQDIGAPILLELARQVLEYRIDLVLFPILLNFYATEESSTVPHILPDILRIAAAAASDHNRETRLAGAHLQIALEDLAETLATRILDRESKDPAQTFEAFNKREKG